MILIDHENSIIIGKVGPVVKWEIFVEIGSQIEPANRYINLKHKLVLSLLFHIFTE